MAVLLSVLPAHAEPAGERLRAAPLSGRGRSELRGRGRYAFTSSTGCPSGTCFIATEFMQ